MKKSLALLLLCLVSSCASNKEESAKPVHTEETNSQVEEQVDNVQEFNKFANEHPIYFEFDSTKVVNTDIVEKYIELKNGLSSDVQLIFEGYCDNRGSDAYNDRLGQKRADAIKVRLNHDNADVVSYGKRKFENYSKDFEENQQANRKVVITAK